MTWHEHNSGDFGKNMYLVFNHFEGMSNIVDQSISHWTIKPDVKYLDRYHGFILDVGNHGVGEVSDLLIAEAPLSSLEGSLPLTAANSSGEHTQLWKQSIGKVE